MYNAKYTYCTDINKILNKKSMCDCEKHKIVRQMYMYINK